MTTDDVVTRAKHGEGGVGHVRRAGRLFTGSKPFTAICTPSFLLMIARDVDPQLVESDAAVFATLDSRPLDLQIIVVSERSHEDADPGAVHEDGDGIPCTEWRMMGSSALRASAHSFRGVHWS